MQRRLSRIFLFPLFLLPSFLHAQFNNISHDSLDLRPEKYFYLEGFGICEYYSINAELKIHEGEKRNLMVRVGLQALPPVYARYNLGLVGGLNFDSGNKNWSRCLGTGLTFLVDQTDLNKTGELSTSCAGDSCHQTLRWGPYLSIGVRYRFFNAMFVSGEFTPILLSDADRQWRLVTAAGISVGLFFVN